VPIVLKSESLNLLEPSGPVQACSGIALPLKFLGEVQIMTFFAYFLRPVTSYVSGATILSNVLFPNTLKLYCTFRIIFMPIWKKQKV
jgi:hypothetical protein